MSDNMSPEAARLTRSELLNSRFAALLQEGIIAHRGLLQEMKVKYGDDFEQYHLGIWDNLVVFPMKALLAEYKNNTLPIEQFETAARQIIAAAVKEDRRVIEEGMESRKEWYDKWGHRRKDPKVEEEFGEWAVDKPISDNKLKNIVDGINWKY